MSHDDSSRIRLERVFFSGERVEWFGCDRGTVVKHQDKHTIIVRWDNPKLGTTLAPTWSRQLNRLIEDIYGDEATLPGVNLDTLECLPVVDAQIVEDVCANDFGGDGGAG